MKAKRRSTRSKRGPNNELMRAFESAKYDESDMSVDSELNQKEKPLSDDTVIGDYKWGILKKKLIDETFDNVDFMKHLSVYEKDVLERI